MAKAVIHRIGKVGSSRGWRYTTCGIEGDEMIESGKFLTGSGGTISAVVDTWEGVTCKSCLRRRAKSQDGGGS